MRMRALILTTATVLIVGAGAGPAGAAPYQSGGYPAFANEGKYPEQTGCKYRLQQSRSVTYGGHRIRLKLYYNGRCGAFGRIENAPQGCEVVVWRTREPAFTAEAADQQMVGAILEPVDPGIDYAYTKVVNNLDGRVARAMVACEPSGPVIAMTDWY